jgi:two-component system, cell cycle sensor histidine kinase and response regulator CckA
MRHSDLGRAFRYARCSIGLRVTRPTEKEIAVMMGLQASGAAENPSPADRSFVVVISPVDLSGDLGLTVLWRSDVQRVMVTTVEAAIEVGRVRPATMFVLGGFEPAATVAALRRLRADAATRSSALAALCAVSALDQEEALRAAGANVVLPTPVDPEVWDGRLDQLLRVPRRRSTRIPVRLTVWSRRSADPEPIEGVMLNVSANGMLLETSEPLPVGARFDLSFRLPRDVSEVHAIGKVVREVADVDSPRSGVEFVVLRADGRERIAAFVDGRRRPRRSLNVDQETSEFEAELRAISARESAILDSAMDSILVLDQEGRIREFNRAAEETFGYRKAEVMGRSAGETIVPPRLRESHRLGFLHREPGVDDLGLNRRTETVALRADGREVAVELAVTAALDRGVKVYTVYMRDISERKRIERDQAAEHATLRILSESSTLAEAAAPLLETLATAHGWDLGTIWMRDDNVGAVRCVSLWRAPGVHAPELEALEGDVFFPVGTGLVGRVSRTGEALWVEDLAQGAIFPRMHLAAKRGMVSMAAIPVLVGRECLGIIELYARQRRTDDAELRTRLTAVGRQLGLFQDRRRAEKALRASEERFRALVENGSDLTALVSADGRFKYVSGPVRRILGRAPEDLVGGSAFEFMHPEDAVEMRPKLDSALAHPGQPVTATYRMQHHDGSWRTLESIVVSHRNNPAIRAIVINARDVSERHVLEEQLRQSQKMEAVGRLAGGIAHDFNNLLAVMLGYTTLTLSRAADPAVVTRNLEQIRTAAERAANLTRQLLTFSRKQVLQPRVVDLGGVVAELHTMLERLIGEDIELVTDVTGAKGHVKADRGQLEQVIVNLAVNARDAMPRGGRLAISTRDVVIDAARAREQPGLRAGRHVRIEVSDDGVGMEPETLGRLFEPFFSTKEKGKGTGLGLATVYGIVKQSGGHIAVESAPGRGTTFRIWLPEVEVEAPARPASAPAGTDAPAGSETILLVEDEEAVRGLLYEVLTENGYNVLKAASGAEALRVSRAHRGSLDLLLTDVVMPGMGGREVATALTAERPGLRVLFASGYTAEAIARHGVLEPGTDLIHKPFTPDALLRRVRERLDRA